MRDANRRRYRWSVGRSACGVGLTGLLLFAAACGGPSERAEPAGGVGAEIESVEIAPRTVAAVPSVRVSSDTGRLRVVGEEDRTEIAVTTTAHAFGPTLDRADERLQDLVITRTVSDGVLEVAFESPEPETDGDTPSFVEIELWVPTETAIDATLGGGDASIEHVRGDVSIRTGEGAIAASDLAGSIKLDTGRGTIDVRAAAGAIVLRSGGGDVTVSAVTGSVDASTGNGRIAVTGARLGRATLENWKGDIELAGELTGVGVTHRVSTNRGDITLRIPAAAELRFDARASVGTVTSLLPLTGQTEGKHWTATLNAPTADLELVTLNGSIRIEALP